jgi:stage II sporulation protein P
MNKHKYNFAKIYHMVIWSVILILSINLIVQSIQIFGIGNMSTSKKEEKTILSSILNYITRTNVPILKFVTKDEERNNYFILNNLVDMFPINQYAMDVNISKMEHYIKNTDENLLFLNQNHSRLNNNYYVSMILRGLQNARYNESSILLAEIENRGIYFGSRRGNMALANNLSGLIPIDIINGEIYMEYDYHNNSGNETAQTISTAKGESFTLKQLLNKQFLYNNFYILDGATTFDDNLFDAEYMLGKDMSIKTTTDKPQILVYHTHSQEAFIDSREGAMEDTIVGAGTYLTKILEEKYGYNVIHDKSEYDIMEGYIERNLAYNHASDGVSQILKENPSIEVVIDVHRDGNDKGIKRVTNIDGKDTAQIMLFNGLSRNSKGKIDSLPNKNLKANLAFSLQLQLKGREIFPGLMYKNYLHAYRYNLHYREKAILAEVGTNYNTVGEVMNSMEYLAEVLHQVLEGN